MSLPTTSYPPVPEVYEAPPEDYVVAQHDFFPPAASSNSNVYLSFQAGDLIRIFNRAAVSGWWDGELVRTAAGEDVAPGTRGWLPSNHVAREEDSEISPNHLAPGDNWSPDRRASEASISTTSITSTSSSSSRAPSTTHSKNPSSSSHRSSRSHARAASSLTTRSEQLDIDAEIDSVLEPILQAIALVKAAVISRRQTHFQPSTACVISSIRSLLAATDCLSRDSPILARFPVLSKIRKTILSNLAELVALARSASNTSRVEEANDDGEVEMREMEMEGMLKASEETLNNVREFLRTVVRCGVALPERKDPDLSWTSNNPEGGNTSAREPEAQRPPSSLEKSSRAFPTASNQQSGYTTPSKTGDLPKRERKSSMHAKSTSDLRLARKQQEEGLQAPPVPISSRTASGHNRKPNSNDSQDSYERDRTRRGGHVRDTHSIDSVSSASSRESRESSVDSAQYPVTPAVVQTDIHGRVDIGAAIGITEDSLLSVIAALIGHVHSHSSGSHPSSHAHLIDLTRETVDKVRELLTLVEAVVRNEEICATWPKETTTLDRAKVEMYEVTGKLVESAERVASAPWSPNNNEGDEEDRGRILQAATGTLRSGTECVRLVKVCGMRKGPSRQAFLVDVDNNFPNIQGVQNSTRGTVKQEKPTHARAGSTLRVAGVGKRGDHTLSSLGRKADGLTSLQKQFERDGSLRFSSSDDDGTVSSGEDGEDMGPGHGEDEDMTLQPPVDLNSRVLLRPGFLAVHSSPLLSSDNQQTFSSPSMTLTPVAHGRSRAASLSSPSNTPRLIQHRSPSKSADLNLVGGDLYFVKTPRQGAGEFERRRPSLDRSWSLEAHATPRAPGAEQMEHQEPEDWFKSAPDSVLDIHRPRYPSRPLQFGEQLDGTSREAIINDLRTFPTTPHRPAPPVPTELLHTASDLRMWLASHDYNPRDIAFNTDGVIVGATLEVLVEKMTPHDSVVDPIFWDTFFLTFRLFTTPAQLLETLELRFDLSPPARMPLTPDTIKFWNERKVMPIRVRILNFLKTWMDVHWREDTDGPITGAIGLFVDERVVRVFPKEAAAMKALLKRHDSRRSLNEPKLSRAAEPTTPTSGNSLANSINGPLPPTPIMNKQLFSSLKNGNSVGITEFHALELARQLTVMESNLYREIEAEELLQTGKRKVPTLQAMSTLSNRITGWVADSILNEQDPKRRTSLLKFFIKLADRCLTLNNFSTLFSILAGLNSSTIMRLKRTWEGLSNKYRNIVESLRTIIEHSRNHNNYRTRMRAIESPALPFVGLILSDITFTSDGNPNTRPSTIDPTVKLINFDKYLKLARIAFEFQRFQVPYNLAPLREVQTFLEKTLTERGSGSLDALYRKSLKLEPREGPESSNLSLSKPLWLGGRI